MSDQEIKNIWKIGFISLDTNVLFNIYRYSEETRKELIKVIKKYSDKLWLTNHCAYEFHKNRIAVISDQIKIYEDTIKAFEKLENDIVKNLKTPHLSKTTLSNFKKIIKQTKIDLEKKKAFYKRLLLNDTILSSITAIFNKKVGAGFSSDELTKIEKEGEERYKRKIPPGFMDNEKKDNKYGDLIIWKELIQKSNKDKLPFIFIIDDVKEDWLLKAQGETISPRPELLQELFKETEQVFHLYTSDRFLEFSSTSARVKQKAIDEVRQNRIEKNFVYDHSISPYDIDWMMPPIGTLDSLQQSALFSTEYPKELQDIIRNSVYHNVKMGSSIAKLNQDLKNSYFGVSRGDTQARLATDIVPNQKDGEEKEI